MRERLIRSLKNLISMTNVYKNAYTRRSLAGESVDNQVSGPDKGEAVSATVKYANVLGA